MAGAIEIAGVRIRAARVPLRRTLATRVGRFTHGPFLLIDLELKGGGYGRLLAFTFNALGLTVVPPLIEDLAGFLKGRAFTYGEVGEIHDLCQKRLTLLGHEGVAQMAISMLDMAIHDALAREAGVPLWRLLGGAPDPIPAYNSCGLGLMDLTPLAAEARVLAAEHGGFSHVKLRLGRERIEDDIAAIHVVRDAIGPDVALSVDFNQGLPVERAMSACRAIDTLDLAWIEEPVVYDDYPAQQSLARELATPLQVGENWWSWRTARAAAQMDAFDYLMPDLLRIGGVTGWIRTARAVGGMPFSSHLSPEFSVHTLAATPSRHWLEFVDWGQELIRDPLVPQAGFAIPPQSPGTGVEWNEAAIAACLA